MERGTVVLKTINPSANRFATWMASVQEAPRTSELLLDTPRYRLSGSPSGSGSPAWRSLRSIAACQVTLHERSPVPWLAIHNHAGHFLIHPGDQQSAFVFAFVANCLMIHSKQPERPVTICAAEESIPII